MDRKRMLPNCITCLRLLGAAALFLIRPFSPWFYWIYTLCGISDVVDGVLARALHCTSQTGALLDTAADLLFYGAMLIGVFPVLLKPLHWWVWLTFAIVVAIRVVAYAVAAVKYHRFASMHTWLNKLTSFLVFLFPYIGPLGWQNWYCFCGCLISGVASLEELCIHLRQRTYCPGIKSIFQLHS